MVSVPEWVPVQMLCGHTVAAKAPWTSEALQCAECSLSFSAPFAVETREWKASCSRRKCPVGRYFGQSKSDANSFANAHLRRTGHPCTVQYQFNLVTKGCVSAAYGRKVRPLISPNVSPEPLTEMERLGAFHRGQRVPEDEPPF